MINASHSNDFQGDDFIDNDYTDNNGYETRRFIGFSSCGKNAFQFA